MNSVAQYLAENVNWDAVFQDVADIGDSLDGTAERFIKGAIVTNSIAQNSQGKVPYVDQKGYDNVVPDLGDIQIEVRSHKQAVNVTGAIMASLHLKNSMGTDVAFDPPDNWYFLAVRTSAPYKVALLTAKTAKEYAEYKGDAARIAKGCTEYDTVYERAAPFAKSTEYEIPDLACEIIKDLHKHRKSSDVKNIS